MQVTLPTALYYNKEATLSLGGYIGTEFPSFEAVALSPKPSASITFIFGSFDDALKFFFTKGIEALRKEFKYGQWSPGESNANGKTVMGFFTHDDKEYACRMLQLCNIREEKLADILAEFQKPTVSTTTPFKYNDIKEPEKEDVQP